MHTPVPLQAIDLPIFEGEVLCTKHQFEDTVNSDNIEFIRAVRSCFPRGTRSVIEGLELVERHFTLLGNAGLYAVQHEWGLVPLDSIPERSRYTFTGSYTAHLTPKDYVLAAKVVVVEPVHSKNVDIYHLNRVVSTYNKALYEAGRQARLCDIHIGQAIYGSQRLPDEDIGPLPKWYLVDIEPVFSYQ